MKAAAKPIDPPSELSDEAKTLWSKIVRGRVSSSRAALIAEALRCLDRLRQVQKALNTAELTTTTPKTGAIHIHPLLKTETELRRQFASMWVSLSLQWRTDIDGMAKIPGLVSDDDE